MQMLTTTLESRSIDNFIQPWTYDVINSVWHIAGAQLIFVGGLAHLIPMH